MNIKELEKKYNLEQINPKELDVVSTGSILLNLALDCGGYPKGKIIEVQGPESSGKSTSILHAIAEFQKNDKNRKCALFDYEHSFDVGYAKALGVDVENLLIYQPDNQEQGLNMIYALAESNIISFVALDSHTAAQPQKIMEGEIGDHVVGLQANFYSKWLAKIKGVLEKNKITLFAVSQTRANIGVMYGPTENTTSGNAWRFYSDIRLKFQKSINKEQEQNDTTITVIKNKCGRPFGIAKVGLVWSEGFDYLGELIDIGIEKGIIKKGGAWLTINDTKIQGKEKFKEFLKDNPEYFITFETKIKSLINEENSTEERVKVE